MSWWHLALPALVWYAAAAIAIRRFFDESAGTGERLTVWLVSPLYIVAALRVVMVFPVMVALAVTLYYLVVAPLVWFSRNVLTPNKNQKETIT